MSLLWEYGLRALCSLPPHTNIPSPGRLIPGQTYESYNTSNNTQQQWVLMWAVQSSGAVVVRLNRARDCITPLQQLHSALYQHRASGKCEWVVFSGPCSLLLSTELNSPTQCQNSMFSVYWSCSCVTAHRKTTFVNFVTVSTRNSQQWRTARPYPHSLLQTSGRSL